ncbi:MAG: GNAT family N-acetyltransferase [Oscillospiraceae bacterium]
MIETKRLILLPLTRAQLAAWAEDVHRLEGATGLHYRGERPDDEFRRILRGQVRQMKQDENDIYHTFWLFVLPGQKCIVGSACFKGPPGAAGEVEIGYGIAGAFAGKGYTTEAARALCGWALAQPGVRAVVAETEKWNKASMRVLQKCGMAQTRQTEQCLWWALAKA